SEAKMITFGLFMQSEAPEAPTIRLTHFVRSSCSREFAARCTIEFLLVRFRHRGLSGQNGRRGHGQARPSESCPDLCVQRGRQYRPSGPEPITVTRANSCNPPERTQQSSCGSMVFCISLTRYSDDPIKLSALFRLQLAQDPVDLVFLLQPRQPFFQI